jgi:hypothetical protein
MRTQPATWQFHHAQTWPFHHAPARCAFTVTGTSAYSHQHVPGSYGKCIQLSAERFLYLTFAHNNTSTAVHSHASRMWQSQCLKSSFAYLYVHSVTDTWKSLLHLAVRSALCRSACSIFCKTMWLHRHRTVYGVP